MVQQKLSGRDYEFQEPTLRRESTVRRENLSGESHGDREEFQPEESEDGAEAQKDFWPFQRTSVIVTMLNREFNLRAERRIIPNFTRFTLLDETPPRTNIRSGWENWRKSKTSEEKTKFHCMDIAAKGRNSVLYFNFGHEFAPMKRSQESSSLNSIWRWKKAHVVSSRDTAYLRDKILQVTLKVPEVRDTLKCDLGREKYELRILSWSANFGNRELRMVQKTLEICLSETHVSGNREVWTKDLSSYVMLIPDETTRMEKEWKKVIKKAHNKR